MSDKINQLAISTMQSLQIDPSQVHRVTLTLEVGQPARVNLDRWHIQDDPLSIPLGKFKTVESRSEQFERV